MKEEPGRYPHNWHAWKGSWTLRTLQTERVSSTWRGSWQGRRWPARVIRWIVISLMWLCLQGRPRQEAVPEGRAQQEERRQQLRAPHGEFMEASAELRGGKQKRARSRSRSPDASLGRLAEKMRSWRQKGGGQLAPEQLQAQMNQIHDRACVVFAVAKGCSQVTNSAAHELIKSL